MPDMRQPYAYIEAEVTRLECEATDLRRQAALRVAEAEALQDAAINLRTAIDKQKRADEEESNS